MKKLSLLLGTLGGAMAGYLLSNTKLREQLAKAKDPEHAAHVLAHHLQRDGRKIAGEVRKFVSSKEVQENVTKAKAFAKRSLKQATGELQKLVKRGGKSAASSARRVTKKAQSAAGRMRMKTRSLS
jgi:hypothetical protein